MSYYKKHLFFCINQKEAGKKCCADANALSLCLYAKAKIKALGLSTPGGIRVSSSGCLGRCAQGPCLVIYPDGVWYSYQDQADIDAIIDSHVLHDVPVSRLIMREQPE